MLKGEKEKSHTKGYDEFLGKPIVLKEMEEVLSHFLEEKEDENAPATCIVGDATASTHEMNVSKLAEELMLDEEQILHLMKIYIKKMGESLEELKEAIEKRDYSIIALVAHSIKGSSSNFRMESLVSLAYELEKAAYAKESAFDFENIYDEMEKEFGSITVSE